ncbi:ABC superfamily ATP binding cassette transporter, ABC protein [Levilactobacillus senmaizukei DSM 21775 = NBRC 103853]|uniref:ABC-type quaternary amine transporter n=1 Tax=Levilactobacillus senmaizukei DSM 21775 = NBRC 103853 TaxID=1423803 RepID=A0A0R2DT98_9LACO|nr:ABC transporter ATP-binding protein [Levilactobacillus senmaizukei]KRN03236.1 ABC superfamily ATP binding cassette transporter, ABC protein [Levilactobacillus senmaizukei DSM 21775 = NBRC 103853]
MPEAFLQIEDLGINLSGNSIINQMNFTIKKNTLTTFLGPSGSGKTTVLRAIAGLNTQVAGAIRLDGEEIHALPANQRNIGMVFQSYALFPNMTIFDNVAYGLRVQKKPAAEIEQAVMEMLETVSLAKKKDAYPDQLSGGQKQRVAIARAMVLQPKLLLLDEPLSALDAKIRVKLREQIRKYQQKLGITMLFVTHDQAEAMAISDDIIVMNDGQVQQQGSPMDIYANPANLFMAQFIGNHNLLTGAELRQLGFQSARGTAVDDTAHYIIRPELFCPTASTTEKSCPITGKITSRAVLGDRIQYRFKSVAGLKLKVELLNQEEPLPMDRDVTLYVQERTIQKVGATNA